MVLVGPVLEFATEIPALIGSPVSGMVREKLGIRLPCKKILFR